MEEQQVLSHLEMLQDAAANARDISTILLKAKSLDNLHEPQRSMGIRAAVASKLQKDKVELTKLKKQVSKKEALVASLGTVLTKLELGVDVDVIIRDNDEIAIGGEQMAKKAKALIPAQE